MRRFERIESTYRLTSAAIDEISQQVRTRCEQFGMERREIQRQALSVEESLLNWKQALGEETEVTLTVGRKLRSPYLSVSVKGSACNPYGSASAEFGSARESMLIRMGLVPAYSYRNGLNTLTFSIKKKSMNSVVMLALVILGALLVGFAGRLFMPETIGVLTDNLLSPVEDTFFRVLSCIAGPMIFLSVAWGVYGIGDVYTLGHVGKRMMLYYVGFVLLFTLFGVAAYPFLGAKLVDGDMEITHLGRVLEMILNVFPANIVSPFADGNTLQIILLGFVIGLSMIFLGQRTSAIAVAVEQINHIINFLMDIISKLVPYFVFLMLVGIVWSGNLQTLRDVGKFSVAFLITALVSMILFLLYVSWRGKVSPAHLVRVCLPAYLIALTTASSSATFESSMSICKKDLGIPGSLSSFGVSFGMVLFKPTTALYYLLFCFYMSNVFDVEVSLSWILIAVIICAVSAVATPPIPGGAAATYTMLFLQLGIPADALAIALAVDMIFDFVLTSGDTFARLWELFHIASVLGARKPTE